MLVLTRKVGESFFIGEQADIIVKVLTSDGDYIRIGIDAPKDVLISREEIYEKQLNSCLENLLSYPEKK